VLEHHTADKFSTRSSTGEATNLNIVEGLGNNHFKKT